MQSGNLTLPQKYILAFGLLALITTCILVPYQGVLARNGDNAYANLGYHFLWDPPTATSICNDTFDQNIYIVGMPSRLIEREARLYCSSKPNYPQILLVFTATLLATALFTILAGLLRERSKRPGPDAPPNQMTAEDSEPAPPTPREKGSHQESTTSLADHLLEDLGSDFPVSGGNGKKDDPLVITDRRNAVAIEYAVVAHVLNAIGEEYELHEQNLLLLGDRHVDELIFNVRSSGADSWQGFRRFYFDIQASFSQPAKAMPVMPSPIM